LVVAQTVVIEAGSVALLAAIADVFVFDFAVAARRQYRRAPVGVILLVGDDVAGTVGLDLAGVLAIGILIAQLQVGNVAGLSCAV